LLQKFYLNKLTNLHVLECSPAKIGKPNLRKIVQYMQKGKMRSRMSRTRTADTEMEMCPIEQDDFEWIVSQNQKRIYRTLLFLVRDADTAETLTQECFLRAFRKRGEFRGESSLATWLVRIAVNLARDHNRNRRWAFWRRLMRTDRIETIGLADSRRSPEQTIADRETLGTVWAAVERLAERQKTIFLLRFVEEMSLEEMRKHWTWNSGR
jgi:RNA polymerase sigma-70 factor, ECF subfamily